MIPVALQVRDVFSTYDSITASANGVLLPGLKPRSAGCARRNGVSRPAPPSFEVRMARPVSCCGKEPSSCQGFLRKWFNRGTVFLEKGEKRRTTRKTRKQTSAQGPTAVRQNARTQRVSLDSLLRGNDGCCHDIPCVKTCGSSSGAPVREPAHRAGSLSKGGIRYRDARGTQGRAASPSPSQQATHSTARSLSLSKRRTGEPQTPRPGGTRFVGSPSLA